MAAAALFLFFLYGFHLGALVQQRDVLDDDNKPGWLDTELTLRRTHGSNPRVLTWILMGHEKLLTYT